MTPERWQQVQLLFNQVLEIEEDQRDEFLRRAAPGDHELRWEVESLLEALDEEDARFERPAVSRLAGDLIAAQTPTVTGRLVGPYRLLREVGSGGMGTVYEAIRADDQYRKRVAIKVVKRGMDSDLVLRRFRQERQILAGLEHPNITVLLDGGVTEEGQPFFAMEYVEGEPITAYCVSRQLPIRERLQLFLCVCSAVHYAHQNLVVHRDLKPFNILVTADGKPKLLDFGVAKLVDPDEGSATLTQAGFHALTPEYASPEQIRGEPITTASDIYSLGIILYELLTGQRPYALSQRSLPEVARIIGERDPTRPSAAISGGDGPRPGYANSVRMRKELAGELDSIILRAIRKEPQQRYSSAEALADDLRRYLDGRPVLARRGSRIYEARKFLGRHRASMAATVLVLLSLAVGAVATVFQARRAEAARVLAEQRFNDVRALTNALLFEVHDAIVDLPGATPARMLLVERGLEYLDRLYHQAGRDPELELEVAEAYLKLGLVQGYPNAPNLGDLAGATQSLERALSLALALVAQDSTDRRARRTVALAHEKLGDVEAWLGNTAGGVEHAQSALASWHYLARTQPTDVSAQLAVAISLLKLGDLLGHPSFPSLGDRQGAMEQYSSALRLLQEGRPDSIREPLIRRYVGMLHERVGTMLQHERRYTEALRELERSRSIREALARETPTDVNALRDAGIAHERICGVHLDHADIQRALHHCRLALSVYTGLHASDPSDANSISTLALGHLQLSRVYAVSPNPEAALEELSRSTTYFERLLQIDPDHIPAKLSLVRNRLQASSLNVRLASRFAPGSEQSERRLRHAATEYRSARALLVDTEVVGRLTDEDHRMLSETEAQLARYSGG